jgi:hypothetical protein
MKYFRFSIIFSLICVVLACYWGYSHSGVEGLLAALGITLILAVLEISLSFDNAVINADVLKGWNAFWTKMFLTVGILIAVFGMRLVFPIVIVAVTADIPMLDVVSLALNEPATYAAQLNAHHAEISAFGGMFLLLVFLHFFMDSEKTTHWFGWIEKPLAKLGNIATAAPLVAILALVFIARLAEPGSLAAVLIAGLWGAIIYFGVNVLSELMAGDSGEPGATKAVMQGGFAGFVYLEILDASFSFDGVIGAFAITDDVILIMLGLAIGAIFVRSMTIFLLEKGTLVTYQFLAHGAHYAIGALALIMLASIHFHVPEVVTGLIGFLFIAASVIASKRQSAKEAKL